MSIHALPAGTRLGDFEIVRLLGHGGFGITYLAFDHVLDQPVAMKEYFPDDFARRQDDGEVVAKSDKTAEEFNWGLERFLAEAQIMAKLKHPNLVRATRYFRKNGTGYIIMDYVEGDSLYAIYKREAPLPAGKVRIVLETIAKGLNEAHRYKIYHRDIKPGNILVDGETGLPVLIDFGAARQAVQTRSAPITTIVSAPYAPYEQYTSQAHRQGPWTDIYSLSVVGYEGLTGKLPPDGPGRLDEDTHKFLDETKYGDPALCRAINQGMQLRSNERPGDLSAWLELMESNAVVSKIPVDNPGGTQLRPPPPRPDPSRVSPPEPIKPPKTGPRIPLWVKLAVLAVVLLTAGSIALPFLGSLTPSDVGRPTSTLSDSGSRNLDPEPGEVPSVREPVGPSTDNAAPPQIWQDTAGAPVMVRIPAGSFEMGTEPGDTGHRDNQFPKRTIRIAAPFAMSQTEITIGDWAKCMQSPTSPCSPLATVRADGSPANAASGAERNLDAQTLSLPVRFLPLSDIEDYLAWLAQETGEVYRLPSEAEWAYAARAGGQSTYTWGNSFRERMSNCSDCGTGLSEPDVLPVKSFPANDFGLYDMAGNVFEVVEDCWTNNFSSAPTSGEASIVGDCSIRTVRGGAYNTNRDWMQVARRLNYQVADRTNGTEGASLFVGFRVVRDLAE